MCKSNLTIVFLAMVSIGLLSCNSSTFHAKEHVDNMNHGIFVAELFTQSNAIPCEECRHNQSQRNIKLAIAGNSDLEQNFVPTDSAKIKAELIELEQHKEYLYTVVTAAKGILATLRKARLDANEALNAYNAYKSTAKKVDGTTPAQKEFLLLMQTFADEISGLDATIALYEKDISSMDAAIKHLDEMIQRLK